MVDSDNQSTDVGEELWYVEPETDGNVTEDDEGEVEEGKEDEREIIEPFTCVSQPVVDFYGITAAATDQQQLSLAGKLSGSRSSCLVAKQQQTPAEASRSHLII